jgi:lipopolysaccharide biosynthesis protein
MEKSPCDFWGLTDSLEIEYHIQSFFLVLRKSVLTTGHIQRFFASVLPYRHKWQVIRSYEIGLTHYLLDQDFVPSVLVSVRDPGLRLGARNPCIHAPLHLVRLGVPYFKVELMRDNPADVRLATVRATMKSFGYPLDLVEVERQPRESRFPGLLNWVNLLLLRWRVRGKSAMPLRPSVSAMLEARQKPGE